MITTAIYNQYKKWNTDFMAHYLKLLQENSDLKDKIEKLEDDVNNLAEQLYEG